MAVAVEYMTAAEAQEARARLAFADVAAWQEYGAAVQRRAPRDVRRVLFSRALDTLEELQRLDAVTSGDSR